MPFFNITETKLKHLYNNRALKSRHKLKKGETRMDKIIKIAVVVVEVIIAAFVFTTIMKKRMEER